MLEKMFTTKMSADKKKLQMRFSKIRSKNGNVSKLFGGIIFGIIVIAIICVAVIIAVNDTQDYIMTNDEFFDYINRPIGSIMAELDYVDDEKLVFHYLEGFFVIDQQSSEIIHKINLRELNIVGHTQGDCFTEFKIDKEGKFAYLSNVGSQELIKRYDNYIINLETGDVKIGEMPDGTALFSNYADTFLTVKDINGFCSDRCIVEGDQMTYYLTTQDSMIGAIQLVSIHHKPDELVGTRYVFGKNYVDTEKKKDNVIKDSLAEGEQIVSHGGLEWEVNAGVVRSVIHKISELRQMPYIEIEEGNYLVTIHTIENNGKTYQKLFIVDNYKPKLILSEKLSDQDYYMGILNILNSPSSELYYKAAEYLEKEFRRVHAPIYDIQHLTISNWQENGNKATFFYKMTYLNYNRDPDKVEYIQEAKKRSQKEYEALYDDYLSIKESNYEFKVILNGDQLELYSNIAPKGTEWVPTKIDDYILSNWSE